MIFKMILKSFDFQCDFDFQITTAKIISILILNHLYSDDLIWISKSSTYDDFAHLCIEYHCKLNFGVKFHSPCLADSRLASGLIFIPREKAAPCE